MLFSPFTWVRDVPSLTAVHLRTLQTFYDRSSPAVVVDQRPLINFTRCTKILERIDDIQRYRPGPSPSPPSPLSTPPPPPGLLPGKSKTKDRDRTKTKDKDKRRGSGTTPAPSMPELTLAWVKKELDKTPSVISREQFEARVAALAAIERQMHESHEPELQSLGFGTAFPRHHRASSSGSPPSVRSPGVGRMASLDSRLGKI